MSERPNTASRRAGSGRASPPSRIVFVNRFYAPDQSATSQMLTDLAVALAADGVDVHIVTSRILYDDAKTTLAASEVRDAVRIHRIWTSSFGRDPLPGRVLDYLCFYIAATVKLLRLVRRGDVVIAKSDPPLIAVPAAWVARMRGALLVNWLQDIFPETAVNVGMVSARGAFGGALRWLRDASLRAATATAVLGPSMRGRVAALGVDPTRIAIIPNWADGARLRPSNRDANPLRAQWALADKLVVGYSGNMGRAHEFETALDAAQALQSQTDVVFLFIGAGAQRAAFAAAVAARQLSNVRFQPYQPRERLSQSLGAIDIHLVTLRPELEGLVVPSKFYGVAAVGRPTIFIGDPNGEIGTVLRAGDCGISVRGGDAVGLVGAIMMLRNDVALRERMGANARRVFDEHYDMPIAIERWQRLLRSVPQVAAH